MIHVDLNQGLRAALKGGPAMTDEEIFDYPAGRREVQLALPVTPSIRRFPSGATRDTDEGKVDYEGFLHPEVLETFGYYMLNKQTLPDGTKRASDNWQLGIPRAQLFKSLIRHVLEAWGHHRRKEDVGPDYTDTLCAILFNVQALILNEIREGE